MHHLLVFFGPPGFPPGQLAWWVGLLGWSPLGPVLVGCACSLLSLVLSPSRMCVRPGAGKETRPQLPFLSTIPWESVDLPLTSLDSF